MSRIPIVPKLRSDELLYSWLLRMAHANGFSDLKYFMSAYVWTDRFGTKKEHAEFTYDIRADMYDLVEAVGMPECTALELYLRTSMFAGIAPLMTRSLASQHVGLLSKNERHKSIMSAANGLVQKINICPVCRQEDMAAFGGFALYRYHHMPGVTVCCKHGCALHQYRGKKYREMIDVSNYEPLPVYEKSMEYARFCCDFLDADLQISWADLRAAMKEKKDQLRQEELCDFEPYDRLMDRCDMKHYIRVSMISGGYVRWQNSMVALMFFFGTVKAVIESLNAETNQEEFTKMATDRYRMTSRWREDIIELQCCTCNQSFLSTPYRQISGWGCPNCDAELSDGDMFKRLFDVQSGGNYELLSEYSGNSSNISVRHKQCGEAYQVRARAFLLEHARCECEYQISETQARESIEASGEFKLIKFTSTTEPVAIKHVECGRTFEWNYYKFLKQPWCKLCKPRIRTEDMFVHEIHDLTGDEYTLVGPYVDKDTKVEIRHNKCGSTHKYLPHSFLRGTRCTMCRKTTREEKKLRKPKANTTAIVWEWIERMYSKGSLIFLEDLAVGDLEYGQKKDAIQKLVRDENLVRLEPGIYSFPDDKFSPMDIVHAKYILRNGKHIGYLTGESFAYEVGLRDDPAKRIGLISNKESLLHGRNRTIQGVDLKIHGSRVPVSDDNYVVLAVLTYLVSAKRWGYTTVENQNEILRKYLLKNKVELKDFEAYYQYFAPWVKNTVEAIYKEV